MKGKVSGITLAQRQQNLPALDWYSLSVSSNFST